VRGGEEEAASVLSENALKRWILRLGVRKKLNIPGIGSRGGTCSRGGKKLGGQLI